MNSKLSSAGARMAFGILADASLWSAPFSFTTGAPDGRLGALSRRAMQMPGKRDEVQ